MRKENMKKEFKPVPDVESLKYHGTSKKPDIKIFVSHRIDQDSEVIDNPLYIPVRCGAVYDDRKGVTMLGDDTGDNISEKRMSFCEYTVMYWAWKNIKADYYGLCHYRRYLSFSNKEFQGPALKQGMFDSMSKSTLEYCDLLNENGMIEQIVRQDACVPCEYDLYEDVKEYDVKSIKESWLKNHQAFLKEEHFEKMLELIAIYSPEYYQSAIEYLAGTKFYGFNCFVMKKELFQKMCNFLFPILFEFDDTIDKEHFSDTQNRAVGYLGEWLFSIFLYHIRKNKVADVEEHQILAFQNTSKSVLLEPAFEHNNIPVVLTATDINRPLLAAQIQSILEFADLKNNYDIIILRRSYDEDKWGTHLRKEQDFYLQEMVKNIPNATIRFYDPKEELLDIEVREWGEPSKEELYYLLLCPWILTNFERVVFLQDKVLIQKDISELFNTQMKENEVVAAPKNIYFGALLNGYASNFKKVCEQKLKMKNVYDYVSVDTVVLDLQKIRSFTNEKKVLRFLRRRDFENIISDGFNTIYEGKIKFISQQWNKIECWGIDYFRMLEYFPKEEFSEQSQTGYALNLCGATGAFLPPQSKTIRKFWELMRKTPFYEEFLLSTIPNWGASIFDLQCRMGVFDTRTPARKAVDKLCPVGSIRRKIASFLVPKNSLRRRVCKKIYYIFKID